MSDSSQQLKQAFSYYKQGKGDRAVQIVQQVLKDDRNNVNAWWMMANILDDDDRIMKSLERVLILDPNHIKAKQMMARLTGEAEPTAQKPKPKPPTDSKQRKTVSALMGLAGVLFVLLLAMIPFLALTGYGAPPPDQVARNYINAAFNGDFHGVNNLTCSPLRMPADQLDAMLSALETQFDLDFKEVFRSIEVDTAEMTYTVQAQDETTATVVISGTPIITADGLSMSLNEILSLTRSGNAFAGGLRLTKEGHNWFVCM